MVLVERRSRNLSAQVTGLLSHLVNGHVEGIALLFPSSL